MYKIGTGDDKQRKDAGNRTLCAYRNFSQAIKVGISFNIHRVVASVMREGIYSTIRLGLYEPFKEIFGSKDPARTPLYKKILSGGISGAIGSSIANPTDLVKIRIQGEGKLKPGKMMLVMLATFRLCLKDCIPPILGVQLGKGR